MIGPALIVFFLVRAALGFGREIPCAANTCPVAEILATSKEDLLPTPVAMTPAPGPDLATLGLVDHLAEAEAERLAEIEPPE
jgi:hypothetical protein